MMRFVLAAWLALHAVTAEAQPSAASSLELWGTLGPSAVFTDPANPEYAAEFHRIGAFGEVGVAYRSRYFIDPFLVGGYATLAGGRAHLPEGVLGAAGTLQQHLGLWLVALGVTSDLWRVRLRFALGVAGVIQRFTEQGHEHSMTQGVLANQFGLGFNALDVRRFRLDAEAQLVVAAGASVTFVSLALVARADLLEFD